MLPAGFGLPDGGPVATRLQEQVAYLSPKVVGRLKLLVRLWEWSPLLSRHRSAFSRLEAGEQSAWLERAYRSRAAVRRLHVAALKQIVFLAWASVPEVEDALGYDYRCRRDQEIHGTQRSTPAAAPVVVGNEPDDYFRPGPAFHNGAVPERLLSIRDFEVRGDTHLETEAWPELASGFRARCDVVVIGSGAGGAVVAATLAERGVNVIVVEEGAHVRTEDDFVGPPFERFQRFCRDDATTQAWGTPPIPMPIGKVVGGTTVVNCGTCFRVPSTVLSRWTQEFGLDEGLADELVPHFEAVEDALNVRPVPWNVLGPNGTAAYKGSVALGYSGGPLLRCITDCHGCGQCIFGSPTNAKQAMHISYLPRAFRASARVLSRCRADRIVVEGGRARGMEGSLLGPDDAKVGSFRIDAAHVVVSAGAVHSPLLLHGSGIPDPSGQTGRNLRIHPATGVGGVFEDGDTYWKGTLQSYYIDEFFDSHGLMFEATSTVPGIGAGSVPGIGGQAMAELGGFRNLATLGFSLADSSSGRVRRAPNGEAIVTYKLNGADTNRIGFGLGTAAEILLAAGASRVYPGLPGMEAITAREDLAQLRERRLTSAQLRLTAFHPMGTVRMGPNPATSVIDPAGRHHHAPGVWVADASTFPTCVGVNPQLTIMAFARRTAEILATSG
jgi:GMC oxidoreductase